jgi:hypothetical protein
MPHSGYPRHRGVRAEMAACARPARRGVGGGCPPTRGVGDAAFGEVTAFRDALTARGLSYVLRVPSNLVVWPPGTRFLVPTRRRATGRPRSTPRPATPTTPLTLAALAATLPHRRVIWREGSRGRQASRFAAIRVHLAHRHAEGAGPGPEVWLLSEWPRNEPAPTKYYLSSLPVTTSLRTLVWFGKLRWRIERDYQELKGELGLDHSKGAPGTAFITTSRYGPPRTPTLPFGGRRRSTPWTIAGVRRHLQALLLRRLPRCPLCRQHTNGAHWPRGPSRM